MQRSVTRPFMWEAGPTLRTQIVDKVSAWHTARFAHRATILL
jgi:hypothetical protein